MPYKEIWLEKQVLRASAVLTNTGYVVGATNPEIKNCNQVILYVAFTIGSLDYAYLKVEFSSDNSTYYQQVSRVSAGSGVWTQNRMLHKFTADGNYRIPIPVTDRYIKVSVIGSGTVTDSLMAIEIELGSST